MYNCNTVERVAPLLSFALLFCLSSWLEEAEFQMLSFRLLWFNRRQWGIQSAYLFIDVNSRQMFRDILGGRKMWVDGFWSWMSRRIESPGPTVSLKKVSDKRQLASSRRLPIISKGLSTLSSTDNFGQSVFRYWCGLPLSIASGPFIVLMGSSVHWGGEGGGR